MNEYESDYEQDDEHDCPECGHSPSHYRHCQNIGCDDGWIDMHEYDDPLWYDEGDEEMCTECWGTGIEHWCPKCGYDFSKAAHIKAAAQDEKEG